MWASPTTHHEDLFPSPLVSVGAARADQAVFGCFSFDSGSICEGEENIWPDGARQAETTAPMRVFAVVLWLVPPPHRLIHASSASNQSNQLTIASSPYLYRSRSKKGTFDLLLLFDSIVCLYSEIWFLILIIDFLFHEFAVC
ncbi:unnamed protein product [Lactuca saligna]|uniref:Uncharacterized protein n=1 Tax=Lactuca saligna TaxID=75948 RepID=A0AA36EHQ3_LACSI|nr:unnamed protein product [Lactuca saligna]